MRTIADLAQLGDDGPLRRRDVIADVFGEQERMLLIDLPQDEPDLVIENLSDLLDVFIEVGEQ